jgi:hypothetical protein
MDHPRMADVSVDSNGRAKVLEDRTVLLDIVSRA